MAQQETPDEIEGQATMIADEIFNLMYEYTHDSTVSKFFLTDEIANTCFVLAGAFASVIYQPTLEPEEVADTEILSFLYALITYGFKLTLKEHSLVTHGEPYSLPTDKKIIKRMQQKLLEKAAQGELVSTKLGSKVIDLLRENMKQRLNLADFTMKGHRLQKKKFHEYAKLSLYWGYNFAQDLLQKETPLTKR